MISNTFELPKLLNENPNKDYKSISCCAFIELVKFAATNDPVNTFWFVGDWHNASPIYLLLHAGQTAVPAPGQLVRPTQIPRQLYPFGDQPHPGIHRHLASMISSLLYSSVFNLFFCNKSDI